MTRFGNAAARQSAQAEAAPSAVTPSLMVDTQPHVSAHNWQMCAAWSRLHSKVQREEQLSGCNASHMRNGLRGTLERVLA